MNATKAKPKSKVTKKANPDAVARVRNPQSLRNLTRFTYERSGFQGWRLCISRCGHQFVKYFGDSAYGSETKALKAAKTALAGLKEVLHKGQRGNTITEAALKRAKKLLS